MATTLLAAPQQGNRKPAPKPVAKKPPPKRPQTGILIKQDGLRADSRRQFRVYRNGRCLNSRGRVGRFLPLTPGDCDVQVGFPSGYVSRKQTVSAGKTTTVPTGLFRFARLVSTNSTTAVPQMVYAGRQYLATGYRGQTARLYPGEYQVYYPSLGDADPCALLDGWRIAGPFYLKGKKAHEAMAAPYPPEQNPAQVPADGYRDGQRPLPWRKAYNAVASAVVKGKRQGGIFYLHTEISSERARPVLFAFNLRYGARVWLNGKPLNTYPKTLERAPRLVMPGRLKQGKNQLLVKAFGGSTGYWPFHVEMERVSSYKVTVKADQPPRLAGVPRLRPPSGKPLPGVKGLVFCKVHDLPYGRSGLHYEQFRIVRRPDKASICTLIPAAPTGKMMNLTKGKFMVAMDPRVSYDGKRFLFTARRDKEDKWRTYEMNVDGTGLRQVTKNAGNSLNPCYLPGGRILYSSDANSDFRDEYDRDVPYLLYTCKPDGTDEDQITFNLSSDIDPFVLDDGRILFTSWQHHGDHEGVAGDFALFTVFPDGSAFMPYVLPMPGLSKTKSYAQQLTDGRVVFVETAGHRHYNGGALSVVHPRKPNTTRQVLTRGTVYNGHNMCGRFASPYPLPDGGMLCSYSPGRGTSPLELDPAEEIHMGIYTFDFESGRPGQLLYDDPAAQDIDASAIYERTEPRVIPRMTIPGQKTGKLVCVNSYLSDRPEKPKYPVVGRLPPAKPGEIKGVRLIEGFGLKDTDMNRHRSIVIDILQMSFGSGSNGGNNFEQKRILGEAPVEPDGSFSVEVPADTTLFLQTLDENGMAIENQLTWLWVRPGETRMCVGCHEDRNTALSNMDCRALYRPPDKVAPPDSQRRTVDFRRDVMPVIEKRCSNCHGAEKPKGGIDLRRGFGLVFHRKGCRGRPLNVALFNHAYETLLDGDSRRVPQWVVPGAARHSPLMWCLYGNQLGLSDSRRKGPEKIKQMPPSGRLSEKELRTFIEWIDLGAQWDNIPGEDPLPCYNAKESAARAKIENAKLDRVILVPREAYEIRCLECHDQRRLAPMMKMKDADIPPLVRRMVAKRKGWIREQEIPVILGHIRAELAARRGKK